jgi:arylsulfatase
LPVLKGGTRDAHDAIFWEWAGNGAMRQGPWKLVWDTLNKAHQWELYDIATDRTELLDLAAQQPERVTAMRASYETWAKTTDRHIPGQPRAKKAKSED